jgi:phospholipase/lecithinase/hemolysin
MRKQILATGFVLFSCMLPLRATAASFSQMYVFGDSASDVGNSFDATGIPPSPLYYQGRFSNGPVWVEYLAQDLGLTPNRQSNFAFGGANTGSRNTLIPGLEGLPGLQQQIDSFKATNAQADPYALYIVWAGFNDYLSRSATDPIVPVNNLTTAVSSLADYGAKDIMVVNLPDLGELPGPRADNQFSSSLNTLTALHNSGLNFSSDFLSQTTNTNIIQLDVNSLFKQAIANPAEFGFTNVTDACLDTTTFIRCSKPDEYFFWDNFHPTTAGHAKVAEFALSELTAKSVPEPSAGLGILALGALGAVSVVKQKQKKARE